MESDGLDNQQVKNRAKEIALFVALFFFGLWALGPLQYRAFLVSEEIRILLRYLIPVLFLATSIFFRRTERYNKYWSISFSFFVGSFAYLVAGIGQELLVFDTTTISGIVFTKLRDSFVIVSVVLALVIGTGERPKNILLRRGNLRTGLIIGLVSFIIFYIIAIPGATLLFYAESVTLDQVILWTPAIFVFVLANAVFEEMIYRGLFIRKYEEHFKPIVANILQAAIFVTPHLTVTYTSDLFAFLGILFVLGLVWGYLAQKTDSLLASILFHAGTDILIVIGLFSTL